MLQQQGNFINGKFQPSLSGATHPNYSPATGNLLSHIPLSSPADVDAAVASAKAAFPAWSTTPVEIRAKLLDKMADLLDKHATELAVLESEDSGKTITMASTVDIPRSVANFRFFAGAIRHDEGGRSFHMDSAVNFTSRSPLGVAALITPWNLPLYLLSWKVAPALACGNTVVCKPSEMTPRTANALAALMIEAGVPPGVFNVVHGPGGGGVGARLCSHPDVKLVSFTGGTATGAQVAATAAPLFKRLSLELGGKNATVIFADTPLEKAVAAAKRAGFANNGQVCLCGSRIFIQRPLYDRFVVAFGAAVSSMVVGDPALPGTEVGPLSSAAHRDKVLSYIRMGVEEEGGGGGGDRGVSPPPQTPTPQCRGVLCGPYRAGWTGCKDLPGGTRGGVWARRHTAPL